MVRSSGLHRSGCWRLGCGQGQQLEDSEDILDECLPEHDCPNFGESSDGELFEVAIASMSIHAFDRRRTLPVNGLDFRRAHALSPLLQDGGVVRARGVEFSLQVVRLFRRGVGDCAGGVQLFDIGADGKIAVGQPALRRPLVTLADLLVHAEHFAFVGAAR